MSEIDLVCLVADKNMEATLDGLLARRESLRIRRVAHQIVVHPRRDPGCFHEVEIILHGYRHRASHALVLLDFAWHGVPARSAEELEEKLQQRLTRTFPADWAQAVVIGPELEAWVFANSPHVDAALGWAGRNPSLRLALRDAELWPAGRPKPPEPKAAVEHALRAVRKPRSSSIYRELAVQVTLRGCEDRAFQRLAATLAHWFAEPPV